MALLRTSLFILLTGCLGLHAQNWQLLNPTPSTNVTLWDIAVAEDSTIYVAENTYDTAASNTISKSSDFGITWQNIGSFPKAYNIREIALDKDGALFVAMWDSDSSQAEILVFKNSSLGFQADLNDQNSRFINDLKFINGVGYATGFRCPINPGCSKGEPVLYKKPKGNTVWQQIPLPLNKLSGVEVLDSNKLYVWNSDSVILYSADGGQNWTARPIPLQAVSDFMGRFEMQSDSVGYCAINATDFYKTTDSCKSWNLINNFSTTGIITAIESYQNFVIVGTSLYGEITYSKNGGATWITDIISPKDFMQAISATQSGVFLGQLSSLHHHNNDIYTSTVSSTELTGNLGKLAVFPNPADDKLYLNKTTVIDYEIYTIHGNFVLRGENITAPIDISKLAKGTYILKATDAHGINYQERFLVH